MSELFVNPRVRWRWEGDKLLLNSMVSLNQTAGEILELCQQSENAESVLQAMIERYSDVPAEKLQENVRKFVEKLLNQHILLDNQCTLEDAPRPLVLTPAMDEVANRFNNTLSAPILVFAEVTWRCDASCLHCSVAADQQSIQNEMTTEEWKQLLDQLAELNVFYITFTGGEPLLREDLDELISYCRKRGIRPEMVTNGSHLTEERIESLSKAGLQAIQVDLDSVDAATHDRFRGVPGLYNTVVKAIPILAESSIDLQVSSVVTRLNVNQIADIMEFANELGALRYSFMHLIDTGAAQSHPEIRPSPEEYIAMLRDVYEREQPMKTFVFYPSLPAIYYIKAVGEGGYRKVRKLKKVGACVAGTVICVFSPQGDVKPCDISLDVHLGNVRTTPFKQIWDTSPVFNHLRNLRKDKQKPCTECNLKDDCAAGCNALPCQIGDNGTLLHAAPLCFECFAHFKQQLEVNP
jgi:radical SAM protein with 4Fe4S-binding SPASM domain